jgi:hypothetical protein
MECQSEPRQCNTGSACLTMADPGKFRNPFREGHVPPPFIRISSGRPAGLKPCEKPAVPCAPAIIACAHPLILASAGVLPCPAPPAMTSMAVTNHGGVMESGENPEQSRCGNRFANPTQSNRLATGGEGGRSGCRKSEYLRSRSSSPARRFCRRSGISDPPRKGIDGRRRRIIPAARSSRQTPHPEEKP